MKKYSFFQDGVPKRKATWQQRVKEWWHDLWCGGWWYIDVETGESECGFCGKTFIW